MKLKPTALLCLALAVFSCRPATRPAIESDRAIEKNVEKILKGLTLEEKVGQMTQITATVIYDRKTGGVNAKGDSILRIYKVGSILNTMRDMADSASAYRKFIKEIQDISLGTTGIPCLYGLDQIHGASYTTGGTLFPQEIALAASFNPDLAFRMGEVAAYETRACNVPWVFTPTLDLSRTQLWPRLWESYGEDPLVQSRMGVAETLGFQGDDPNHIDGHHVGVSIKHYMAYGAPVSGQDRTPSSVSRRDLKEKYFAPFKACIRAGALTLMVNSSTNDGIPFHANGELLTGWAKEGLGWDGMIVTDWADVDNLYSRDHFASSDKDAIRLAVNAGIDLIMEPYSTHVCDDLVALVREGEVPMSRIDDAVRRILRLKFRLGLFDDPYGEKCSFEKFGCDEFTASAREAAVESEVLLKNEGSLLPLDRGSRILLVGPNADSKRVLGGGWNYSWQGNLANEERYTGRYNSICGALKEKFASVTYVPCLSYSDKGNWQDEIREDYSAAVRAARSCDVIVACIGENTYCETPGNIDDLSLSENQRDLVKTLSATGKPIVLILSEGRPRVINDIEPLAGAVVDILLPGNYGSDALASLLCGEENFSARLPLTYPRHTGKLTTYDYRLSENKATMDGLYNYDAKIDVQWPFGHGLSYTEFRYSNLRVDRTEFKAGDTIEVSVDVSNVGGRDGKESVLLFSSDLASSSITPEVRRLRDFTKISLKAGESTTVRFSLDAGALAFVDRDLDWLLEKGEFRLSIADQSVIVNCTQTSKLNL